MILIRLTPPPPPPTPYPQSILSLPSSVDLNGSSFTLSFSVRNLGGTFDQSLSFLQHVTYVSRLCYLEIRRIFSARHFLTVDATKTLLCAFVLSHLDYCNAMLAGSPNHVIEKLQKIQSHAARLVFRCSKFDRATPLVWIGFMSVRELTTRFFSLSQSPGIKCSLAPLWILTCLRSLQPASLFIWRSTTPCS